MKEAFISIGCALISGFVAWIVAKQAAKAEIKKLQTIWAHEKETACDTEFDSMAAAFMRNGLPQRAFRTPPMPLPFIGQR